MNHLSRIAQDIWLRICNAYADWRLSKIKQHWQAGALGGASIQLGNMTRAKAIRVVQLMESGPIVYVDDQRGFIAYGDPPPMNR